MEKKNETLFTFLNKYKNIHELLNDKDIFNLDYEIQGIFNRQTYQIVQFENIIYNNNDDDFSGVFVDGGKLFTKNNILASFHTRSYKTNIKMQHTPFNGLPTRTDINILLREFFYYEEDVTMYIFSKHGITQLETDFKNHNWNNEKLKKINQDVDEISLICSKIASDAYQFDNIKDIIYEYKKYIKHFDFLSIKFFKK